MWDRLAYGCCWGVKYTGFLWPEACCVIFKSPLGVFPDRAFFDLWPSSLKTQFIDAWLALPDGHLTIFLAAAPP